MQKSFHSLWLAMLIMGGCVEDEEAIVLPGLSASFDYTMPARFKVPDPLMPEGQYEIYTDAPLHPSVWTVNLDACASTGSIVEYRWTIDGSPAGVSTRCGDFVYDFPAEGSYSVSLQVEDSDGAQASHLANVVVRDFLIFGIGDSYGSGEGNPDVRVSLSRNAAVAEARAELDEAAAALDAAGQSELLTQRRIDQEAGNPATATASFELAAYEAAEANLADTLAATSAQWQNRRCHRSAISGQVRAAQLLEESDPHSSVTFVHLACSGARVHAGLLEGYPGVEEVSPNFPAQMDRVAELAAGHEIDALLVSIGGNDVNFSNIIEACILGEDCHLSPQEVDPAFRLQAQQICGLLGSGESECMEYFDSLVTDVEALDAAYIFDFHSITEDVGYPPKTGIDDREDGNDDLPDNYDELAAEIVVGLQMDPARVYLTGVPDVTRDERGQYCGWDTPIFISGLFLQLPGVTQAEMEWASTYVSAQLQETMQDAANRHGWTMVPGIAERFGRHGYCSVFGWLMRVHDSFLIQGDKFGILHPNAAGHGAYAEAIVEAFVP